MAEVNVPPLFSEGAVLQRDMPIPVWGGAGAGEAVAVTLNGSKAETTADAAGHWALKLPALAAGGPFDLIVEGKNKLIIHNIAIGEVWVGSGQSNMAYPLETFAPKDPVYGPQAQTVIAAANDPLLRMFTVSKQVSPDGPLPNVVGTWKATTPENAAKFSAVGYYYALELRHKLNVPVGIIISAWSGSPAQAWTSRDALAAEPTLKPDLDFWNKRLEALPAELKTYDEQTLPAWTAAVEKAKAENQPVPAQPHPPDYSKNPYRPATLFNGMISPLIPYGIRGVIWYQGETNAADAIRYRILFPAMIKDWRSRWGEGDFPFLFFQLANFQRVQTQPVEEGWAPLREAQMLTLSLPNTGMAVTIDLADAENPQDVHPHNRAEMGRRLALIALAQVYNQTVSSYSGPLFSGVQFSGAEARLNFTHVDGGLEARGGELEGFALAGTDGKFVWAKAKIDGDNVVVSSVEIPQPAAVRYSWATNPIGNLYNKEGLPASPFRTDIERPEKGLDEEHFPHR